jgi:hypothetical protein
MGLAVKRHLRAISQNLLQKSDAAGTCEIHVYSELLLMSDLKHYTLFMSNVRNALISELHASLMVHRAYLQSAHV